MRYKLQNQTARLTLNTLLKYPMLILYLESSCQPFYPMLILYLESSCQPFLA